MFKTKLVKSANAHFITDINKTISNINQIKHNIEINSGNFINSLFIATKEFYKISTDNYHQIIKLISILEEDNNNFNVNNCIGIINNNEEILKKNYLINDLKLILSINNTNLNNYYYDFKIILKKLDILSKNQNNKLIGSISNQKRQMSNNNYNNKTIDNRLNRHNYNKLKLSPINSLSDEKENKNIIILIIAL